MCTFQKVRELDDGSWELASDAPTAAPVPTGSSSSGGHSGLAFRFLFVVGVIAVLVVLGWRSVIRWRRRREQLLLDRRAAQAHHVLGDMQMVPNEDLDDNEFI
jgi:hypothetical protein